MNADMEAMRMKEEHPCSIQRVKLELMAKGTSVDSATALQGALMKECPVRPATNQERLILHTICKVFIELKFQ